MIFPNCAQFARRSEAFFRVTPYIAEFWNTLSNIPFIVIGFLRYMEDYDEKPDCINTVYLWLIVVGFGSAIHHATIPKWTIVIDWIPILICLYHCVVYGFIGFVTIPVIFELLLAISILIVDHTTNCFHVPWGHVMWHIVAAIAIDSFIQNVEKQMLIQNTV